MYPSLSHSLFPAKATWNAAPKGGLESIIHTLKLPTQQHDSPTKVPYTEASACKRFAAFPVFPKTNTGWLPLAAPHKKMIEAVKRHSTHPISQLEYSAHTGNQKPSGQRDPGGWWQRWWEDRRFG